MKKNIVKLIEYFFMSLLVVFITGISVFAVTEDDLNEINSKIQNANTELAGIKENMSFSLDQINKLNVQIKECEDELENNNEELNNLNEELDKRKAELEIAKEEYNNQKEKLENRLIAIYESSKTTYLEVLLGSNSLSDFISKYYMLEELTEYDTKFIQSMEVYKDAYEVKNNLMETKKEEVENKRDTVEAQVGAMEVLISDKNNLVAKLSKEEIELNNQLEQFELDKKEIEKELKGIAEKNNIEKVVRPSNSGYISPLIGKTKEDITTGYRGYSGHTGVDFAIPLGTDVVAVKAGTVVISDSLKYSNGKYRSYGEYVVVDHHDGTMTLYAHGTPNSRVVNVNDEVSQRTTFNEIRVNWKFNWSTFAF